MNTHDETRSEPFTVITPAAPPRRACDGRRAGCRFARALPVDTPPAARQAGGNGAAPAPVRWTERDAAGDA